MAYFLYAASACVLVFALFFLFLPDKKLHHYFMCIAFSCLGYILFYFGSSLTGLLAWAPVLYHSDISVTLIAAPAIYLVFVSLMSEGKRPVGRYAYWFAVPILVSAAIVAGNIALKSFDDYRIGYPDVFSVPILLALNFLGDFGFTFFFALALYQSRKIAKRNEIAHVREFHVMVRFVAALFCNSLFLLSAYFFRIEAIFSVASVFYAVIVTAFCLMSVRMPDYILGNFRKISAPASLLKPDEVAIVRERLAVLMEQKHLFKDSDLTLKRLAHEVRVTPHQLSWFINRELGVGFAEYVNRFRLEAVKADLIAEPNKPILEIALDNGFGSKTSFNAFFLTAYGVSPRDWRKQNGAV
jgi:AraC-like DNA-binding protein